MPECCELSRFPTRCSGEARSLENLFPEKVMNCRNQVYALSQVARSHNAGVSKKRVGRTPRIHGDDIRDTGVPT